MNIASSFCYIFRSVPVVLFASSSTAIGSRWQVLTDPKEPECKWTRLRMRALSRDRSRCRGCDTKGDEVTLRIHLIRPDASDLAAWVTLCVKCDELAKDKKLEGISIPEFLRHLWRYIYHRNEPVERMQNDPAHIDVVRTRERLPVALNATVGGSSSDGIPLGVSLKEVTERQAFGAMTAEGQVP